MRIGLQIPDFTFPRGPRGLAEDLTAIATTAEDAGFDLLAVMDHFFQIEYLGPEDHDMLEAYTTLGYLAARTSRLRLLTVMTGAFYRHPAVLAKAMTTLDVLSGGRGVLGIGAGWNESESTALGIDFPPTAQRFEILEDTLRICLAMWSDGEEPLRGSHFSVPRPLNVPQALSRPHPPIMIGGGGERKTLRLVARYAQACNLFGGPEVAHKLDVLRAHCETEGRDYAEIEKTVYLPFTKGPDETLTTLREYADLGVSTVIGAVPNVHELEPLRRMGSEIVSVVREW
jgi:F420-dependent oxidoreductase-like protein